MGNMKYICPKCSNRYDNPYCTKCHSKISQDDWIIEDKEVENEINNVNITNSDDLDKKPRPVFYVVMVILCFIGIIGIIDFFNSSSSTDDYKSDAYAVAQHYVEEKLKAPKTADFPWYDESYVTVSGNQYTVSAYVDAENSFGANVRTYFTVTMTRNGDNWEHINVTFK